MKNYRKAAALMTAAAMIATLAACGGQTAESGPAEEPAEQTSAYTIKIGHTLATATPQHQGLLKLESLVEERTNGAVQIEIYPSSQIGDERELVEGIMTVRLEIC